MSAPHPLLTAEGLADPYPYLARLRAADPVHWDAALGAWVLTRYDDVMAALRDPRLSADRITSFYEQRLSPARQTRLAPTYRNLSTWMVFNDPPDHTRLRRLVNQAFTPRTIEALRPRIVEIVDELLTEPLQRGRMNLIREFAYPLPAIVIAELLGVPAADRDRFKRWSDDLGGLVFGARDDPDRHERAQRGIVELDAYLRGLLAERRAEPRSDLLSRLTTVADDGETLSEDEIVSTASLLLFAGHETTTDLIGNGILCLLDNPDQLALVRQQPELARPAVEEVLRAEGPSRAQLRVAASDFELRDRRVQAGQRVLLVLAAANRDPAASGIPTGSTSHAMICSTSRSGTACTSASARHSRGPKARSRSPPSPTGSIIRVSPSLVARSRGTPRCSAAGWRHCRSPSRRRCLRTRGTPAPGDRGVRTPPSRVDAQRPTATSTRVDGRQTHECATARRG